LRSWRSWGGYWGYWGGPCWVNHYNSRTPGHVQNTYTWFVQVNVFSLNTNNLIYTANTSTTRPGGTVPLFEDVSNTIRGQLSKWNYALKRTACRIIFSKANVGMPVIVYGMNKIVLIGVLFNFAL
jgi:hypothetical protein